MTVTDSDRILAAGVPIKLAGGEARLRFDFLALYRLEKHYGSIPAAVDALDAAHKAAINKLESDVLEAISMFVSVGLVDATYTPEQVLKSLDMTAGLRQAIIDATSACMRAWVESFPLPRAEGNESKPPATPDGSPGPTSTGSSPASQDAAMATSGA